ncbi:MAG TPA: hypothetical protein VKB03_05930 [Conexibacter sp.]|nr:hypothetical protein [Conexibacter sp.]
MRLVWPSPARLDAAVAASHGAGSPQAALASVADRTGIGLHRRAPRP